MSITLSALQQQRRDTAANWTSANPTLLAGEIGVETDTGLLKIGDGSTAWTSLDYLPLSFEGYAANGIYNPAANQVALATNGTGRLFIDSSGNIGVGTSTPAANFQVKTSSNSAANIVSLLSGGGSTSTGNGVAIAFSNESALSRAKCGIGNVRTGTFDRSALVFYTNNDAASGSFSSTDERLRIDSSGNVGIGVSTISEGRLVIKQNADTSSGGFALYDSGAGSTFRIWRDGAGNDSVVHFDDRGTTNIALKNGNVGVGTTSPGKELEISSSSLGSAARIRDSAGYADFLVYNNNISFGLNGSEKARISSSGNVGIGDTSPSTALHITNYDPVIRLEDLSSGNANIYAEIDANSASGNLFFDADPNNAGSSTVIGFKSDGAERMRIDSSGRVGIGTTNPSAKLAIVASGNINGVEINPENSTDTNRILSFDRSTSVRTKLEIDSSEFFHTNNATETFRIDSSGNVGIGTSSPSQKLHVLATSAESVLFERSGAAGGIKLDLKNGDGNTWDIYNDGAELLSFRYNDSAKVAFDSSGNVGINTSSPSYQLDVKNPTTPGESWVRVDTASSTSDCGYRFAHGGTNHFVIGHNGTSDFLQFYDNIAGAERMRIDSSGNVGIGTTSPNADLDVNGQIYLAEGNELAWHDGTGTQAGRIYASATDELRFEIGSTASRAMTIDSSGRLLVGTSSSRSNYDASASSLTPRIQAEGTSASTSSMGLVGNNSAYRLFLCRSGGSSVGSNTAVSNGNLLGELKFNGADGTNLIEAATISSEVDGTPGTNDMPGRLVFSTTADGASSPTERMRINRNGEATFTSPATGGYLAQYYCNGGSNRVLAIEESSNDGVHSSSAIIRVGENGTNSRSINASGTINASGSDYAEYMTKSGNFTINKGDICGITVDGLLTNQFMDAISFVVKSTFPSYVGGDAWGLGLPEKSEELETARQAVDRIAFAGQVPVNVTGATPGQYIVPVQTSSGGIEGIARNEADLTLGEYMKAIGKVIANEEDGRARIIVKVS